MTDWTIDGLAAAIRERKVSAVEVTTECLERIGRLDGRLRAFITVDAEGALASARALDADAAAGRWRGALHGVPLAYKDLCHIRGLPTSCGTKTAEYFIAEHDATAVSRLRAAGAITLGKLNMTELALGPFGDNAHHGHADNPWRAGHLTGGSSSGSGVAVAAGLALGALGTDTGGSIRLPAACCGIAGLKPTYGRVSRAGVMPLSWSNDHVGPMARTVRDAARLLQVIAGRDPRDGTSSHRAVPDYTARHRRGRGRASRGRAGELLLPRARRRDGSRRAGGDPTPRDAGRAGHGAARARSRGPVRRLQRHRAVRERRGAHAPRPRAPGGDPAGRAGAPRAGLPHPGARLSPGPAAARASQPIVHP